MCCVFMELHEPGISAIVLLLSQTAAGEEQAPGQPHPRQPRVGTARRSTQRGDELQTGFVLTRSVRQKTLQEGRTATTDPPPPERQPQSRLWPQLYLSSPALCPIMGVAQDGLSRRGVSLVRGPVCQPRGVSVTSAWPERSTGCLSGGIPTHNNCHTGFYLICPIDTKPEAPSNPSGGRWVTPVSRGSPRAAVAAQGSPRGAAPFGRSAGGDGTAHRQGAPF